MSGIITVLWREFLYFKRKYLVITLNSIVSPLLYIIAFGLGLGRFVTIDNMGYLNFLIPGILALTTMNTSFTSVSTPMTLARIHDKTLEEYIIAPISRLSFTTGKIIAGALNGLYSAIPIVLIAVILGIKIRFSFIFFIMLLLNSLVFSSLGFFISIVIKSHLDLARFRNLVITPMSFLCGTFFSIHKLPLNIGYFIKFLPLTPSSYGLRTLAIGNAMELWMVLLPLCYLVVFLLSGLYFYRKVE